jgi:hypothetical protein
MKFKIELRFEQGLGRAIHCSPRHPDIPTESQDRQGAAIPIPKPKFFKNVNSDLIKPLLSIELKQPPHLLGHQYSEFQWWFPPCEFYNHNRAIAIALTIPLFLMGKQVN